MQIIRGKPSSTGCRPMNSTLAASTLKKAGRSCVTMTTKFCLRWRQICAATGAWHNLAKSVDPNSDLRIVDLGEKLLAVQQDSKVASLWTDSIRTLWLVGTMHQ